MFPLADPRGRVLGFGARQMREGRGPKYLNTSENELYHKGRQLFGIDRARGPAAKTGRIVLVEGYTLDVLALHQTGIREAVAIMGTAFTQDQLSQVIKALPSQGRPTRRHTAFLALDADRSGQEAMLRASRIAEERGLELQVVEMPEGTDPAELVSLAGAGAFEERMARSVGMIQFQVRRVLADADMNTPAGRDKALEEARKLIAAVPERTATREAMVREVMGPSRRARRLGHRGGPARSPTRSAPSAIGSAGEIAFRAEREFLIRCLSSGELGRRAFLVRLSEEQFASDAMRRARAHLATISTTRSRRPRGRPRHRRARHPHRHGCAGATLKRRRRAAHGPPAARAASDRARAATRLEGRDRARCRPS